MIAQDAVFGVMEYKHNWYKQETLPLWGKNWDIWVATKAYSAKPITDAQRESYLRFKSQLKDEEQIITETCIEYINSNCADLAANWLTARMVNNDKELAQILTPTTLFIKQNGRTILLFDCPWDEHGIGVELFPKIQIGSQDLFL